MSRLSNLCTNYLKIRNTMTSHNISFITVTVNRFLFRKPVYRIVDRIQLHDNDMFEFHI